MNCIACAWTLEWFLCSETSAPLSAPFLPQMCAILWVRYNHSYVEFCTGIFSLRGHLSQRCLRGELVYSKGIVSAFGWFCECREMFSLKQGTWPKRNKNKCSILSSLVLCWDGLRSATAGARASEFVPILCFTEGASAKQGILSAVWNVV